MKTFVTRRRAISLLIAGTTAFLATTRDAVADLSNRLRGATKILADLGFSFSDTSTANGTAITTQINVLPAVQYNMVVNDPASGVTPRTSSAYLGDFLHSEMASNGEAILDLTVNYSSGESIYQIMDKGIAPCVIVETKHIVGTPGFRATYFDDNLVPRRVDETLQFRGTNIVRSSLFDMSGAQVLWIVDEGEAELLDGVVARSIKATNYVEGSFPRIIIEAVSDVANAKVRLTVLDQDAKPSMTLDNDMSYYTDEARMEIAHDADFQIKVGADTYALVNGALILTS